MMFVTGQPTHAYDLAKINGATIGARYAKEGEKINLLNGKTATLTAEDIVIADTKNAVGVAGVMGGSDTEVDETTTEILLEVASFDMYSLRKTAMRHGLFTDAFTRFSKGQSPLQNDRVLAKFMAMLSEVSGAEQAGPVADLRLDSLDKAYADQSIHAPVVITPEFINERLGTELKKDEIAQILRNVEMAVVENDGSLEITAPFWRTDIEIKEDIVEEVGRLYGFDRLELALPERTTKPTAKNELFDFKQSLRDRLAAAGANEVLSYSFTHGDTLKKVGIAEPDKWAYHIRNAVSPDLQYYRVALIHSLLARVHPNLKADLVRSDDNEFALFEIGKVHIKGHDNDEKLPEEFERLALVFAADEKTSKRKYHGSALYMAKHYLLAFLNRPAQFDRLTSNDYPITSVYEKNRSATITVDGELLGVVGEIRQSVKKALKLPDFCAGFELDLGLLAEKLLPNIYEPIAALPKTQQDITLAVGKDTEFGQLFSLVQAALIKSDYKFRIVPRDIYDNDEKQNITFRIWLWHPDKTLKTDEANKLLDEIAKEAKSKFGAERV